MVVEIQGAAAEEKAVEAVHMAAVVAMQKAVRVMTAKEKAGFYARKFADFVRNGFHLSITKILIGF